MRIRRSLTVVLALVGLVTALPAGPAAGAAGVSETPAATASVNGRVHAAAQIGDVVYLGGSFTEVRRPDGSTVTRNRLAAVNVKTGDVTSWNPAANGTVLALAPSKDGSRIFAGGDFTTIKGKSRARLAKIYTDSGGISSWNPGASSSVRALVVKSSSVFAGGTFSTVGGRTVNGLAKISGSSGSVSSDFKPRPNGGVRTLALAHDGSRLYVGGNFTTIGGSSRRYLAAVSTSSGSARSWAPNPDFVVFSVATGPEGSRIYAGGAGTGGRLAAYKVSGGGRVWEQTLDGDVNALAVTPDAVYAGGHFHQAGGTGREKLAAFAGSSGALDSWNPGADSIAGVYALHAGSGHLWAGGDFTVIGGRNQPRFAGFPGTP
jgi:hypothetical protein